MAKYYSDIERYEYVRKYRISGKTIRAYAQEAGIKERTLGDWVRAYNNLHGKFINVNTVSKKQNNLIETEDVRVNMLSEVEKKKKSAHFSRFDHSIVVIEYKEIKITTSLEQAEKILEKII